MNQSTVSPAGTLIPVTSSEPGAQTSYGWKTTGMTRITEYRVQKSGILKSEFASDFGYEFKVRFILLPKKMSNLIDI